MRQIAAGIAIAVGAAVGASGVTALANGHNGGGGAKRHHHSFTLVEHPDTDTVVHTGGGTADAVGDQLPFANPVYDAADAMQVGTDQGNCVRTVVGTAWECTWTTFLKGGQITVQGPYLDAGTPTKLAITGGTGRYEQARGQMTLRPNAKDPNKFDFVFDVDR